MEMDENSLEQVLPLPDVGRAILLNQINIDRDKKRSMEDLTTRRSETYAIRELWRNLQSRRSRRSQGGDTNSARGYHVNDILDQRQVLSSRSCNHHTRARHRRPATSSQTIDNGDDPVSFPPLSYGRQSGSAPPSTAFRSKDALIPYHTAITMPPDKTKMRVGYNALNRKLICHLPHVNDAMHFPGYTTRDMREWENEVKKIVPSRPKIFLPAEVIPRPMSIIFPPDIEKTNDPACCFRHTSNKMAGKGKEYMINPEWSSEKHSPDSVRSRAHCVYTWNV
ncbi:uncharacterized protein LOC101845093 [Aplysia californica]|uniref:Uncharacterized protein LOC101845093 n=1 Tax=Aplysia californica TaxID=6500 RepID=A0ABM0ZZT1_APLCA|nr:uncharacterized protein LOC101845093 [Aplysia californica]